MNFQEIKRDNLNILYSVTTPYEKIEKSINDNLIKMVVNREIRLDGVRLPKRGDYNPSNKSIILSKVKSKFSKNDDFFKSIASSVVEEDLYKKIEKKELPQIMKKPAIKIKSLEDTFSAEVGLVLYPDVPEEVEVAGKIDDIQCNITDKDVDNFISELSISKPAEAEYKFQENDNAIVDISIEIDGNIKELQKDCKIKKSDLSPNIAQHIIGKKTGDEFSEYIEFPKNMPKGPNKMITKSEYKQVAGKKVRYILLVKSILSQTKADPKDKNIHEYFNFKDRKSFINAIKAQISDISESIISSIHRKQYINLIKDKLSFEIPEDVIKIQENYKIFSKLQNDMNKKAKSDKKDEKTDIHEKYKLTEKEKKEVAKEARVDFFISHHANKVKFDNNDVARISSVINKMSQEEAKRTIDNFRRNIAIERLVGTLNKKHLHKISMTFEELRQKKI